MYTVFIFFINKYQDYKPGCILGPNNFPVSLILACDDFPTFPLLSVFPFFFASSLVLSLRRPVDYHSTKRYFLHKSLDGGLAEKDHGNIIYACLNMLLPFQV